MARKGDSESSAAGAIAFAALLYFLLGTRIGRIILAVAAIGFTILYLKSENDHNDLLKKAEQNNYASFIEVSQFRDSDRLRPNKFILSNKGPSNLRLVKIQCDVLFLDGRVAYSRSFEFGREEAVALAGTRVSLDMDMSPESGKFSTKDLAEKASCRVPLALAGGFENDDKMLIRSMQVQKNGVSWNLENISDSPIRLSAIPLQCLVVFDGMDYDDEPVRVNFTKRMGSTDDFVGARQQVIIEEDGYKISHEANAPHETIRCRIEKFAFGDAKAPVAAAPANPSVPATSSTPMLPPTPTPATPTPTTASSIGAPNSATGQCLKYEPEMVELTGYVIRAVGTTGESYYALILHDPICVGDARPKQEGDFNTREDRVQNLQIIVGNPSDFSTLSSSIGHQLTLSGTLSHAQTAHHHTDVLISPVGPLYVGLAH